MEKEPTSSENVLGLVEQCMVKTCKVYLSEKEFTPFHFALGALISEFPRTLKCINDIRMRTPNLLPDGALSHGVIDPVDLKGSKN